METPPFCLSSSLHVQSMEEQPAPTWKLVLIAAIAAGVQFSWALQLSLLTPYIQLLGIPHTWAAYIWLCGPISGMIVQPIVGFYSDRCRAKMGRRRPYIISGACFVAIAVILVGFAADIGYAAGDDLSKDLKPRAIVVFVLGFWVLDVANNMLQGPCRALLADLCVDDTRKMRSANTIFSMFMAVGNVIGYGAGSYNKLHKMFPFAKTEACDLYCANLKSCFIIAIMFLAAITVIALSVVSERQYTPDISQDESSNGAFQFFGQMISALEELPKPMILLLIVTCLNWIGWFPFLLFDTDWMGKEVYGGTPGEGNAYSEGVRVGSLGLVLNSVVLGLTSLVVEFSVRGVGGMKLLWGCVNCLLAAGFAMTVVISKVAQSQREFGLNGDPLSPSPGVKAGALLVFAVLGIPLSVTFSIPFALASIFARGTKAGQGLSLGVLNIAICVPQIIVSCTSGPVDAAFGGGNLPMLVIGLICAAVSGALAVIILPNPQSATNLNISAGVH